jgi:PTS system mannose-specific IIA component
MTHPGVGSALLTTASRLLAVCPTRIRCLDVPVDANTETILMQASGEMLELDDGEGVLVLTDAYGSTPSNIACRLAENHFTKVVSGINLPMLIRVFNYFTEDLDTLSHKAVEGGIRGIQAFDTSVNCNSAS